MAKIEPGIYEPRGDDIRVFDGAEDDLDDEGSRLPLLIVIALLVLAAFAGVVYLAYTEGVQRGHTETPRVINASPGPAKVAPTDAGGTVTPYKGLKIYEQPAPSDEDADSAPPPPSEVQVNKPAATTAPFAQEKPNAQPAPALKPATPPAAPSKTVAAAPQTATPTITPRAVVVKPAAEKAVPAEPKKTPAATKTVSTAATAPPKSLTPPVTAPAKETAKVAAGPAKPVAVAPKAKPEVAKPAPAAATPAPATGSGYVVQIGSYKSEADATAAFNIFKTRNPALLGGFSPNVKRVDLGAKGVWYRLRVGSFADKDGAVALCSRMGGGCLPAKP
jgi:cell division protein FtsN